MNDDQPQSIGRIRILHTRTFPSRYCELVVSAVVAVSLSGGGGCFIFSSPQLIPHHPIIPTTNHIILQEVMSDEHGVDPTGTYHGKYDENVMI